MMVSRLPMLPTQMSNTPTVIPTTLIQSSLDTSCEEFSGIWPRSNQLSLHDAAETDILLTIFDLCGRTKTLDV